MSYECDPPASFTFAVMYDKYLTSCIIVRKPITSLDDFMYNLLVGIIEWEPKKYLSDYIVSNYITYRKGV